MKKILLNRRRFGTALKTLTTTAFLCSTLSGWSQLTYQKKYDVQNNTSGDCRYNEREELKAIAQDRYGNNDYYFTGGFLNSGPDCLISSHGSVVKLNKRGEVQWAKSIGYEGYHWDIKCAYDGDNFDGLIVGGYTWTRSPNDIGEFELLRIDANGNRTHQKRYGEGQGLCTKVLQTVDQQNTTNGFLAVGLLRDSDRKLYVVKTDDDLNLMWDKTFQIGTEQSKAYSVIQTYDKGYMIAGESDNKAWIIKLNSTGGLVWQELFSITNSSFSARDLVEVYNGSSYDYHILGRLSASARDIVLFKIDGSGSLLSSQKISFSDDEEPSGIVNTGSALAVNGTIGDRPFLFSVDYNYTAISFAKRYTNSLKCSPLIKTSDQGYAMGGSKGQSEFYMIKTLSTGISDCHEENVNGTLSAAAINNPDLTVSELSPAVVNDVDAYWPINVTEEIFCKEFCRGVTTNYSTQLAQACYGVPTAINANCPAGSVSQKWYNAGNLTSHISTGGTLTVTLYSAASYVLRCFNADGCVLSEITYNVSVSSPPVSYPHDVPACYGQNLLFSDPCSPNTAVWTNPSGQTSPWAVRVYSDQHFSANCVDANGCIVSTQDFFVTVTPPVSIPYNISKCMDYNFILDNYGTPGAVCNWTDNFGNPVPGGAPFTLPPGDYHYQGQCEDVNGCITFIDLFIHIDPCLTEDGGGGEAITTASGKGKSLRSIELYPNPAGSIVKVEVPVKDGEAFNIVLKDILGKEIIRMDMQTGSVTELDIAHLPKGIYTVEVEIGGETVRQKLIIQ